MIFALDATINESGPMITRRRAMIMAEATIFALQPTISWSGPTITRRRAMITRQETMILRPNSVHIPFL
ncbi:hypothetical protein [Thalassobacillus sp. CUG 92003]|uniref:hypothetical protein n=1 Tax=Thalassobacillus sp. CUG 92003 TaxID=2736641 RepID=UPI0015E75EB6|nr:hypothetical protein [Thalassobacillus sp. CUG 92003]